MAHLASAFAPNSLVPTTKRDILAKTHLLSAGKQVYDSLLNIVVWTKDQAGMYRAERQSANKPVIRRWKH